MTRSELKADRAYYDRKDDMFFYTPDGVGGFWYTSARELREEHGYTGVIQHVSEILDY